MLLLKDREIIDEVVKDEESRKMVTVTGKSTEILRQGTQAGAHGADVYGEEPRLYNGIVVQYSFHHAGRAKSRLNSPLREQSKTSKGPPLDCTLCHYIV